MKNKILKKNLKTELNYRTVPDDDLEWAKQIVDDVFFPTVKKQLDHINKHLYNQRKIRAGIEIKWFFDQEGQKFHQQKD